MILPRILGVLLLAGVLVPAHRLLDPVRTGLAGASTRAAVEPIWEAGLLGTLVLAMVAILLARLVDPSGLRSRAAELGRRLAGVPSGVWAAGMGAATTLLAAAAARFLFGGLPTTVDEMVQLLHARALAAGGATLPLPGPPSAWTVQNGLLTGEGWASVYPPGHTLLLAAGLAAGAAWLVGPLAAGATSALTALGLDRLLEADRGVARGASMAVALSPFLLLLGGTHLSHTSAAALAAVVFWASLRARDGHAAWSLLVGAAVGALVCTRPWTGLVLGTVLPLAAWLPSLAGRPAGPGKAGVSRLGPRLARLAVRLGGVVLGGSPFAAAFFWWNTRISGHPLRLGYTVAFGPAHGLGFHRDPWGNAYGPVEALAYTGSDLLLLGSHLLETPAPALAAAGIALVLCPRLLPGAGLLLAWGVSAVLANGLYWHHGIHLGPRLLYESAPAWAALTVVSVAALLRLEPPSLPRWRAGVTWAALLAVVGAAALLPGRVSSVARGASSTAGAPAPPEPGGPALVLVHGSGSSRVAARLAAAGMRRDSVETLLRRNDLCLARAYADWRSGASAPPPRPDLTPRSGRPPTLRTVEVSPGNRILLDPDRPLSEGCARELRADAAAGTLELEPLLWRAPPLAGRTTWVARDLGPEANRALLARHPDRTPWVLLAGEGAGPPRLLPYAEGMSRVWGVRDGG